MRVLIIGGTGLIITAITRALINIFDNAAAKSDLNFRYSIPFVEGVPRIVAWLDARGRIHDKDEPEIYSEIIENWRYLSTKDTFFRETDSART